MRESSSVASLKSLKNLSLLCKDRVRAGTRHKNAFEAQRKALTLPPTVAHFDDSLSTFLSCDALGVSLGLVLLINDRENTDRRVAYASLLLTLAERAYFVRERAACVIWAAKH